MDGLPLDDYRVFHATRAELLRRLGRSDQARAAYDRAIGLAGNSAETAHLMGGVSSADWGHERADGRAAAHYQGGGATLDAAG